MGSVAKAHPHKVDLLRELQEEEASLGQELLSLEMSKLNLLLRAQKIGKDRQKVLAAIQQMESIEGDFTVDLVTGEITTSGSTV